MYGIRRIIGVSVCAALLTIALAASASTADAGIGRAVDDVIRQSQGHRLVILGDLHGTREIPLLVGGVVERLSTREPVLLALEMPSAEQGPLDAAMASRDASIARRLLLARPWWQRSDDQHDGRRSLDMLDLIERMRVLKHRGHDAVVLAYDVGEGETQTDPSVRDRVMAGRVRQAYLAAPGRRVVMLTGNFHAFLKIPSYMQMPTAISAAGMQLADLHPASLRIGAKRGTAWGCVQHRCQTMPAYPASEPHEGEYSGSVTLPELHVGRLVTVPKS
ncbi:calcium-binding protein [Lysobacter sp. HA35]